MELRHRALEALREPDPDAKVACVQALWRDASSLALDPAARLDEPAGLPGRPARPELRQPTAVPKRSPFTPEGLAALLHAVAHIEFNAINLALDAIWRFPGLPEAYYRDWLRVAQEEAYHFTLLHTLMRTPLAGAPVSAYGDFPAHDGLWSMCEKTKDDVLARMALVPRTLEARGLDASPPMQARLRKVGSPQALRAVEVLGVILHDEIGHVAIGNRWYRWLCERDAVDPVAHYRVLTQRHQAPRLKAPFNDAARRQAGFTDAELAELLAT